MYEYIAVYIYETFHYIKYIFICKIMSKIVTGPKNKFNFLYAKYNFVCVCVCMCVRVRSGAAGSSW